MPKRVLAALLLVVIVSAASATVLAVQDDPERQRAFALFNESKIAEALPLFEKLAVRYPEDREVLEPLGMLLISQAGSLKDAAARKEMRKRGREVLVKAQKLGANSALLKSMLESVTPDGDTDEAFSTKKEVDEAMREGEAAFMKADMKKAIEMYQKALLLDPNVYEAALFTGDVYYKTAEQKKAGEWFARAIAIDPDRETAYRYWGDSLMKQGRATEAGEKFVEAYIAEPYSRLSRAAFVNWAQKLNVPIAHPEVQIPANVTPKEGSNVTITLDPSMFKKEGKNPSDAAWLTYGLVRASWTMSEFAKQYPKEKKYRHSLKEEAAAFRSAIRVLEERKVKDPDRSLQTIVKLEKEGLLEAFILLAMPDEGIAQDFPAYRKTNADNLRRYVKAYVLNNSGSSNP